MSTTTGVTALDHTVQETNVWLKAIDQELALENRHHAYNALRAVLHALRDRLPPEVAVKFGAQLPIMVRGIFYEGWHMAATPTKERHLEEFAEHILRDLSPQFPIDPLMTARGVYEILWEKLDPGEFGKLMAHLPAPLRTLQD
ncbi:MULTISPECIES: DUF2267 domain-containing protein [Bradyrhizobium]|uniref:DUF2267 domain-containing protein n=1 Tax=Bradyrhizobium TaxID=374 RepID=UPI00067EA1A4|nr:MULTISPECIES: DUF2267 domain-containing protein [Bradyrhizobium]PAY07879.1 DUF2267 domain-containing protein [Bradyrhizobium sp. UFLA03-84]